MVTDISFYAIMGGADNGMLYVSPKDNQCTVVNMNATEGNNLNIVAIWLGPKK